VDEQILLSADLVKEFGNEEKNKEKNKEKKQ
jgi:hypothetical protein